MPGPRVTVTSNGDSHQIGRARQKLKLAAIAYANARHGVDADVGMSRAGLAFLCQTAIEYVEALTGAKPEHRPIDPHLQLDNGA